jgi:Flp pilus assembly pilin Flp
VHPRFANYLKFNPRELAWRMHLPPSDREEGDMRFRLFRNRRGQSATEYMLIIAVVVLGLVSAASHFIPVFNQAVATLAQNVSGWISTNQQMANPN